MAKFRTIVLSPCFGTPEFNTQLLGSGAFPKTIGEDQVDNMWKNTRGEALDLLRIAREN